MAPRNWTLALTLFAALLFLPSAAAAADPKLVPFPEDALQNQPPAQTKPAAAQPPKSNFKPRFRVPAVKQAQHQEPVVAEEKPSEQATPAELNPQAQEAAEPQPVEPSAAASAPEGRAALEEAFAKSKSAQSEADYSAVIESCQKATALPLSKAYQDYARQLTGWAYNRRGEARAKENKHAEALADFEAAVEAGGAWRAIHNRGVSYAAAGRDKEALADFERVINTNPRYANAFFNRGELRTKQHDVQGAIRDYTAAITLGPPTSPMYASRAHAYYRLQRFGDALRDYGEAVKLDPSNAVALINRGDTYSDVGKYGEAAQDYRAAVKVAPKSGRAFQAAAWLMATCPDAHYRDEKLAVDAAKRAVELDGPNYRHLSTLAAAQASAGMFKEAQQTQEQAIATAPKEHVVTAEKMMSLYQREIAYRDRPFTAFTPPEELKDSVRPASGAEPAPGPTGRRAWFSRPADEAADPNSQGAPRQPSGPPPRKAGRMAPSGRI